MVADSKCRTFFGSDGSAQIADDDWVSPETFAAEMADHLRNKKQMNYYLSAPNDHAFKILQLIGREPLH